jgi:peptide/nickel transport system substrate-binding protein
VAASTALQVVNGPENRVIFLGMDQKRDELLFSDVKGRNPFKDRRVRQALYQAIDIEAIRSSVMREAARPMALMVTPEVNGYAPDLAARLPYDPAAAKRLLAEAGYAEGFSVRLDCPNDRYVNDARICQAVAANLARVGVRVQVNAEGKATWLPRVMRRETSFYLLGWAPVTVDAHNTLYTVIASPGPAGRGAFNLGSYANPKVDELTERIAAAPDRASRDAMIHEALRLHQEDIGHIPLHQQFLSWGARRNVSVVQLPSGRMPWKYVRIAPAALP